MNSGNIPQKTSKLSSSVLSVIKNPRGNLWRFRLALAVILTLTILPYLVGRTILIMLMVGKPEAFFLVAALVVILIINLLTYHLHSKLYSSRENILLFLIIVVGWISISGLLVFLKFSNQIPRLQVASMFIPTTLIAVWFSWMFFIPAKAKYRWLITFLFILPVETFVSSVEVEGLSGEGRVDFVWRKKRSSKKKNVLPLIVQDQAEVSSSFPKNSAEDYPQFLGSNGTGMIQSDVLAQNWKEQSPRELWRKPVGNGWSSFAIVGKYAFTQEQRESSECVVCYDVENGDILWIHEDHLAPRKNMGGNGPKATPSVFDGRVYTVGATGVMNCLDALTGKVIWSKNILEENEGSVPEYEVSNSPLIVNDYVIVAPTGTKANSLVAYDRISGERIWSGGESKTAYGSPKLIKVNGQEQVAIFTSRGVYSHDIQTGDVLWSFPWESGTGPNCSQPVLIPDSNNEMIVSTGYGKGAARFRILKNEKGEWSTEELWTSKSMKCKFTTPVVVGEYLYGLDNGIFACLRLEDGKKMWKKGRYEHGQIILAGEYILVQTEKGGIVIVEPDPSGLKEVGKFKALSAKTWNNPALAGSILLVRNGEEAVCFDLAGEENRNSDKKELSKK